MPRTGSTGHSDGRRSRDGKPRAPGPSRLARRDADVILSIGDDVIGRLRAADSPAALATQIERIGREMGFEYFALIHHVDLRTPRPGIINLTNYPPKWCDLYVSNRLFMDDPIVHACLRTNEAFRWDDIPNIAHFGPRQEAILAQAARFGLRHGITVPAMVRGEPHGSCTFATSRRVPPRYNLMLAQFIGSFGFAAARRLAGSGGALSGRATLSPRQRECLVLIGQGKSDWEIGTILGLSRVTVKHYVDDARRAYDVSTRAQLLICALLAGEIGFAEVAPWQYVQMVA